MFRQALATVLVLLVAAVNVAAEPLVPSLDVDFKNCVETIGVGLVPTANVLPLIPEGFIPVGIAEPVTPLVARTARCDVTWLGQTLKQKNIVQIGVVIVPPDGTGDINNYTLFYYTDDIRLWALLNLVGVDAQFVPRIQYQLTTGPQPAVDVRVPFPASPRLSITGNVTPSSQPVGAFVANWWHQATWADVKMQTTVPAIRIGTANLSLSTPANSELATLAGSSQVDFPVIQQFNTFDRAKLRIELK